MEELLEDVIKANGGVEVTPMDAYTDIFRLGEHLIQCENEPSGEHKANPIGYYKNDDEEHGHYRILFEDTFEEVLRELQTADFSILNGITYFGRKNVQAHASKMCAMIFDFDGVTPESLKNFMAGALSGYWYPLPQYMALSGHNLHLYYVFEDPISLYPYTKIQLKKLKFALTDRIWNKETSEVKPQHQGINQGFRVLGGKSKVDGVRVRVFQMNTHPCNIEDLDRFFDDDEKVDQKKLFRESKCTMDIAKKKYPKWYEEIVIGKRPRKTWTTKRSLYDWWKEQIMRATEPGHRYFGIMCLAVYAAKCGITEEELKKDAYAFVPILNARRPSEPFTEKDVDSALECYDPKYCTFPRDDIAKISGIPIKANKRNGRARAQHVKMMNYIRDEVNENKNWREGNGRKKKWRIVANWRKEHPAGSKAECRRDTDLSRPTIDKWWDHPDMT